MCCKFRHQLWMGFSCIRSFIWGKQISCTSTTNHPTQPSVRTCWATESSPLRWMFPRGNAAVSCKSRRITCALCPHVPVTSWDTAGNGCYPSGGATLPPHLSPGAHEEGGGNFRNSHPRTGKAFSMFLAEISLSTSLPVLLLPVRPVTEEMLNSRSTSADLVHRQGECPCPSLGNESPISWAVSCKFKTKKWRKKWLPTGKLQLMEQGQCPCLLLPHRTVSNLGWVTWVQHSTVTGKGSAVQHRARHCCWLCP